MGVDSIWKINHKEWQTNYTIVSELELCYWTMLIAMGQQTHPMKWMEHLLAYDVTIYVRKLSAVCVCAKWTFNFTIAIAILIYGPI